MKLGTKKLHRQRDPAEIKMMDCLFFYRSCRNTRLSTTMALWNPCWTSLWTPNALSYFRLLQGSKGLIFQTVICDKYSKNTSYMEWKNKMIWHICLLLVFFYILIYRSKINLMMYVHFDRAFGLIVNDLDWILLIIITIPIFVPYLYKVHL